MTYSIRRKAVLDLVAREDPCPRCGTNLHAKSMSQGGGVVCPQPLCGYWFCY